MRREDDVLDVGKLGSRHLHHHVRDSLAHFCGRRVNLGDEVAARIGVEAHASGAVVVEALRVAEILEADGEADAAVDPVSAGRVSGAAGKANGIAGQLLRLGLGERDAAADHLCDRKRAVDPLACRQRVAWGERIAQAELDGIELECARKLVHLCLVGEADLDGSETAHGAAGRVVGEDGLALGERAHVAYACAAMKVIAEVDVDLGLTRVVWIGTAQDVGRAMNPQAVYGQIEGGTAQGLGLALMEELQTRDGVITNASFTDYLIPTALDMPPVSAELIEEPEPDAPYGAKGVGEPPTVVSTAAIVAALRNATGRELTRVPVRPDDIVGL